MKLTSLRLFGFKTFAEATTLVFEPGITALVGPNGSGKSNLVDAIRWVLGEQSPRSLRSTKTEDVIFAGNERRKPLGMAEVSLTFDNSDGRLGVDFREVQITRRAYRAGESEFYINRTAVRLRDVVELLMGTGLGPGSYAIVSQGQIDAFLSEKPTERRSLFEETAGINKFLARKNESLRRLEQTETNAIRTNDLLVEIGARIPELETQVRRAKRHRRATARLRDLEILAYLRASASRRDERQTLGGELTRREAESVASGTRASTLEAELAALRSRLYAHELALEQTRASAQRGRAELAELESQLAAAAARREALDAQSLAISDDRERVATERRGLLESIAALEAQIVPQSEQLEAHRVDERRAATSVTSARAALDGLFARLREVEAAAALDAASEAERRAQVGALAAELTRLEHEAGELRESAQALGDASGERSTELAAARATERDLASRAAAAAERSRVAETRVAETAQALSEAQDAYRATTSELAGAEARLHTIEELEANLEGHVPGTRAILEESAAGRLSGIVGVVSSLVRVEQAYARALDIAFGASLSNIVTRTSEDAERAIAHLSARELGRATFLPLDTLGARTGRDAAAAPRVAGVVGYAYALVETATEFAGIVAFLVGRILVVETLAVGVRLVRREGFRDSIVTLDGDQITGGGAMTGGRYRRERSILSRAAQARSLRATLPGLRERLAQVEAAVERAAIAGTEAAAERDEAARANAADALALRDVQSRIEALTAESQRLASEAQGLRARSEERASEAAGTRQRLATLDRPVADVAMLAGERERLETELAEARERIATVQSERDAIGAEVGTAREALATRLAQRDAERSRLELLDAEGERAGVVRAQMRTELEVLSARLAEAEVARAGSRERVEGAERADERARRERDAMNARASTLEGEVRVARTAERDAAASTEGARLRLAEIDAELGMLTATFAQNPATADECADVETRYANETGDVAADVVRLRDELARLANVNLNAENERDELVARDAFLREQLDDLARAREVLLASIHEIEQSSQVQFNETFSKVKDAFEKTFPALFPGGQAKMWQTNPESLAETGIEIAVQPPGKKLTALAALSGGERAMTAAALIFALIRVRPSPFYLLDEVDAALDDANVERFSAMVRELAGAAQLVLVTHNKKTMELADRMYGVTMAEPGISTIIAADLSEAEREVPHALAG
ncbi:MAG: chromosome segregation protein SMC [Candidatus Baltobacteraceae bacterium]